MSQAAALGMAGAVGGCASMGAGPRAEQDTRGVRTGGMALDRSIPERHMPDPGEHIRMAFIGVGSRGGGVLKSALKFDDVDVVAITDTYDVWRERGINACKKKRKEVNGYKHFEDMLDKEELHAVYIGTPDHIHFPAIMAALDHGIDVYSEKPMTLNWYQAKAVRDRVRKTGAVFQTGTQLRSMPMYQKAREIVQSGYIGHVVEVNVNRHTSDGTLTRHAPPPEANAGNVDWEAFLRDTPHYDFDLRRYFVWRLFKEYSNGVAGDLMVHHIDMCHFILGCGMPERVMAAGGIYEYNDGRSLPDTISVLAEYSEKFHFNYTTTMCNGHYGLVERYLGTEGTLEVRGMGDMKVFKKDKEQETTAPGIFNEPHLKNFFECIRSREDPIAPVEAGMMGAICANLAVMSVQSGNTWHWNARTETASA